MKTMKRSVNTCGNLGSVAVGAMGVVIVSGCGGRFDDCRVSRTCDDAPVGRAGAVSDGDAGQSSGGRGADNGDRYGNAGRGGAPIAGSSAGERPVSAKAGAGGAGGAGTHAGSAEGGGTDEPGGANGTLPRAECQSDVDCDDGRFCDGREACRQGICMKGDAPCTNPDAAHCAVTCTEGSASASCVVVGRDGDGDGYPSAACIAAPGNDCDDA